MSFALSCSSSERHERPSDKLTGALGSNDVSILFPLPAPDRIDGLLSATDEGAHGQILPWSTFTLAPDLIAKADAADTYAALRVVSARVDPCFPSLVGAPSASCRFQVRLVLQPLFEQAGELAAADAALHLFYDSSASELVELLADLLTQRANQPAESLLAPLTVHPVLAEQGLDGQHASELRQALLRRLGERRLTRMTFMRLGADERSWTFGGFDFVNGTPKPIGILASSVTEQTFANASGDPLELAASVQPETEAPEDLSPLYDSAAAASLGTDALWPLYESILRIENPDLHSPESVDCVSCHSAQPARLWLERNTTFAGQPSALRYASAIDLGVDAISDTTSVLRAFGYFGSRPAISARVANESAAVATYLNENVLTRP